MSLEKGKPYYRVAGVVGLNVSKQTSWFHNFIYPHMMPSTSGAPYNTYPFPDEAAAYTSQAYKIVRLYVGPQRSPNSIEHIASIFSCYGAKLVECQSWPEPEPVQGEPEWRTMARNYEAMISAMVADDSPTPMPEFVIPAGFRAGETFVNKKVLRAYPTTPCPADLKSATTWEETGAGAAYDWGAIALAHANEFEVNIFQLPPLDSPLNINRNPVPEWLASSNFEVGEE